MYGELLVTFLGGGETINSIYIPTKCGYYIPGTTAAYSK